MFYKISLNALFFIHERIDRCSLEKLKTLPNDKWLATEMEKSTQLQELKKVGQETQSKFPKFTKQYNTGIKFLV